MTNETSASTSASGDSSVGAAPGLVASAACIRSGLKAGMLADSSEVDSARLLATRTKARTRTISRLPTRLVWVSRMTRRWLLVSVGGGSRSDLRTVAARSFEPRSASCTRSGTVAKLLWPSSDAKTAPPMRAAPHRPVRIVPLNHCTDTRRRSMRLLVSPSTDNGGSWPRSI